jgi:glutaconate CoA-transferase subunit A
MRAQQVSLELLAGMVPDGASVAIGGTLFTRMPVALLAAVAARRPRGLHYLSWGGGFPLEMLLEAGAVDSATMCFSSLDIFGQAPRFRAAVESGALPLTELSAHAFHQGLWAGRRRLPSEPMIWPGASDLTTLPGFPQPVDDPVTGERVGAVAAIRPDVLLLHAQAADEHGDIEIFGARGVDPTVVTAAKTVLVTVEEIVPRERLGVRRGSIVLPKQVVTALAVVPGGAGATSCLPYYAADYPALSDWAVADSVLAGATPRTRIPGPDAFDAVTVDRVRHVIDPVPAASEPTVDEWMTVWLARQYDDDSICSVGAVSPLASASYLLAQATHAPELTLITNGGGYLDVRPRPLLFGISEWLDARSAISAGGGDETYEVYYQPGLVTHEVVSVAQVDAHGRTNNRMVTSPSGRSVRLPGQGGMADVADMHRDFFLYLPRQSVLNTPESVDFSTAARALLTADERRAAGLQPGRIRLVTNLAVFGVGETTGRFGVEEVFPWTTFDELRDATGFDLGIADLEGIPLVDPPTAAELTVLREVVDPWGLRRLEFTPSKEREPLLREVLGLDTALTAALFGSGS